MYKVMYVCDHCGKDMGDSPKFTVTFKSNTLAIQEPKEWHYCSNCWTQVKRFLSEGGIVYNDKPTPFSKCGCYLEDTIRSKEV